MNDQTERPAFFEGQFLGAADLDALLRYARDLIRAQGLGGQTWGIVTGLDLVEAPSEGGGVDLFVMPGMFVDGYGRAGLVRSPLQVPPALFSAEPTALIPVWLGFAATPFSGLRDGFETCGAQDAFARVLEDVELAVGERFNVRDRQSGVTLAGTLHADARIAGLGLDDDAPILCDGSLPHQVFPADTARWLIPLGAAQWTAGVGNTPGSFAARSADALRLSRTRRRLIGAVAESVFAAQGVIRLRDRYAQFKPGDDAESLCRADWLQPDDLIAVPDRDDPTQDTDRLVGRELVWVEGDMRATGQVRLFGTRLELRDANGLEAGDAPLYLRRAAPLSNLLNGQDLQAVIGATGNGADRLTVGWAADYGDMTERLILRSDGIAALGTDLPHDLDDTHTLIARPNALHVDLAVQEDARARIGFRRLNPGATPPTLGDVRGQIRWDDENRRLRLSASDDLSRAVTIRSDGSVGIRTGTPGNLHPDADDLVIRNVSGDPGLTLLGDTGSDGSIHFADGNANVSETRAGFIRYAHSNNRLHLGTNDAVRVTVDSQGDLGIGTEAPNARLDIRATGNSRALKVNPQHIRAEDGGAPAELGLQPNGGTLLVHGNTTPSTRVAITSSGRVGIGTETPNAELEIDAVSPALRLDITGGGPNARLDFTEAGATRSTIEYQAASGRTVLSSQGNGVLSLFQNRMGVNLSGGTPSVPLHVRGTSAGSAAQTENHVALIENTSGNNADVLALRVAGSAADTSNNFVTFFDQTGAIGRIERSATATADPSDAGSFLRLVSGGADFAERLPRAADVDAIGPGRVVGVTSGTVSLDTSGAEALLITTDRAVVVGNARLPDTAEGEETVAMVGQVRVALDGAARPGDFILPSGRNDGRARAVSVDALTPHCAAQIVGRCWEHSAGPTALVAVGVQGADAAAAMTATLAAQDARLTRLEAALAALAP